jgi:hypothetical protein
MLFHSGEIYCIRLARPNCRVILEKDTKQANDHNRESSLCGLWPVAVGQWPMANGCWLGYTLRDSDRYLVRDDFANLQIAEARVTDVKNAF